MSATNTSTAVWGMLAERWRKTITAGFRADIASFRRILGMLRSDPTFLAFHEGRTATLPEFYHRIGDRVLGRYARAAVQRRPRARPVAGAPGAGPRCRQGPVAVPRGGWPQV